MLEQLREDATGMEVAPPIRTGYPEDKVRLIDVLLRQKCWFMNHFGRQFQAIRRFCLCFGLYFLIIVIC